MYEGKVWVGVVGAEMLEKLHRSDGKWVEQLIDQCWTGSGVPEHGSGITGGGVGGGPG